MRPPPRLQLALRSARAALLGAAALSGCAATPPEERGDESIAAVRPAVVGQRTGLETQWWVVRDTLDVPATLARLEPAPLDEPARARLEGAGLRVLRLPTADLDATRATLHTGEGPDLRQWLGVVTEWTELAAGPRVRALDAGAGPEVARGVPRLAARCYPLPGDAPRLQIDLAAEATGAGRVAASWLAEPATAYLVVSERPGVDWAALLERERPEGEPAPGLEPAGPIFPEPPTLGGAILEAGDRRAVLVILPHIPPHFGLLPN